MVKLKNSQMEEMYRTRYGERAQSLQALAKPRHPLLSSVITRKLSKPNFKLFMEAP